MVKANVPRTVVSSRELMTVCCGPNSAALRRWDRWDRWTGGTLQRPKGFGLYWAHIFSWSSDATLTKMLCAGICFLVSN